MYTGVTREGALWRLIVEIILLYNSPGIAGIILELFECYLRTLKSSLDLSPIDFAAELYNEMLT